MNALTDIFSFLSPFLIGLLTATGIGLIIGLEREFNTAEEKSHLGGIRTFPLVAIAGFVSAFLSAHAGNLLLLVISGGFLALIGIAYFVQTQHGKLGLTTEMALLLTFLLGALVQFGFIKESVAVVVLVTTLLSMKDEFHGFIRQITEVELFAFIKFIVLALLILPALPDQQFGPENLLNYRELGWIVVIVLSISFAGYLLLKFAGTRKGILLTALIGGLFSSTMVAWVFSLRSREKPQLSAEYGAGIILSSSIMFIRVLLLSYLFFAPLTPQLVPALVLLLSASLIPVLYLIYRQKKENNTETLTPGNPLDIKNAAFFTVLYVTVSVVMFWARKLLGDSGAYITGALAGIADIDAITISTTKWAATQPEQLKIARNIIIMAVLTNTVFKLGVSLLRGSNELRKTVLLGFGLVLLLGGVYLVVQMCFV